MPPLYRRILITDVNHPAYNKILRIRPSLSESENYLWIIHPEDRYWFKYNKMIAINKVLLSSPGFCKDVTDKYEKLLSFD